MLRFVHVSGKSSFKRGSYGVGFSWQYVLDYWFIVWCWVQFQLDYILLASLWWVLTLCTLCQNLRGPLSL
jgi:hypothetical protein